MRDSSNHCLSELRRPLVPHANLGTLLLRLRIRDTLFHQRTAFVQFTKSVLPIGRNSACLLDVIRIHGLIRFVLPSVAA